MFNNHGIPAVYRFEEGSMPKLEKLVIDFGDQIKQVDGIEHLKNLNEVQYTGNREKIEGAVNSLKQLITEVEESKTVTFKVSYADEDNT